MRWRIMVLKKNCLFISISIFLVHGCYFVQGWRPMELNVLWSKQKIKERDVVSDGMKEQEEAKVGDKALGGACIGSDM